MREERFELDGTPTRLYDPGSTDGLLLLGHGGGRSKDGERFIGLCRQYATRTGLAVVCIDAVDHGDRRPAVASPGIPRGWHSSVMDRMVSDWRRVANSLASIGPPVAYVGFSMGSIFGIPTVASLSSIRAAVFVVGGIPSGDGIKDDSLGQLLLQEAATLHGPSVLMLSKDDDEVFPVEGAQALLDAIPGAKKYLEVWPGAHDDWPQDLIDRSVEFLIDRVTRPGNTVQEVS